MTNAIPTLGYPSRKDAVMALTGAGLSPQEIADKLKIPISTVYNHRTYARGSVRKRVERDFSVSTETIEDAEPQATARGISVAELFRRIVEAVIADDLVDAVLDDQWQGGKHDK